MTAAGSAQDLPGLSSRFGRAAALGSGVSKRVYVALDRVLGREVALAQIDLSALSSAQLDYLDEAKAIARVSDHRNIATIHDVIEYRNFVYFVMQYFEGGDLRAVLDGRPSEHVATLLNWAGQMLDALAYAHRQGIIHRDVKPDNVFLDAHGEAHLGDFGLATTANSFQGHDIVGTPEYMAPEQIRGEVVDGRADLYSLGCTLQVLATGRPPFEGSLEDVLRGHLSAPAEPLTAYRRDLPPGFVALVGMLLNKAPDERPGSAQEARVRVDAAIRELRLAEKYNISVGSGNLVDAGGFVASAGDYLLLDTLEESSSATVSRARHAADDREVVIRMFPPMPPEAAGGLEREIERLGSVAHPGLIPVLESGLAGERVWYATAPHSGQPLAEYLAGRRPLGEVTKLFADIASALSVLHASGIVHGDLNPGDVIVGSDGRPCLTGYQPSLANLDGAISGVTGYTAPERILGERLDARADLYSLGCMLFEAVTGQPAFAGDHTVDLAHAHLESAVRSPRELVSALPVTLEDLILGLLEKTPARRIGHAFEVVDELVAAVPEVAGRYWEPFRERIVFQPRTVGRNDTLERLASHLEGGISGAGAHLLITGEPGVGKSTLVREAIRTGPSARHQVFCKAVPHTGQDATRALEVLLPLLDLIVETLQRPDSDPARLLGDRGRVLAEYKPALSLLPWVRQQPPLPEVSGVAAENRVINAFVAVVGRLVADESLLLVVDDIHWADALSLRVLMGLAALPAGGRIAVLATARTETNVERARELTDAGYQRLELAGIDRPAVADMLSDMLAHRELPDALIEHVAAVAMGNPLIVSEMVRAMIESETLDLDRPQNFDPAHLGTANSIDAIVGDRISHLDGSERACLDGLAVIAEDIDEALLAGILREDELDPAASVAELLKRGLILESKPGHYHFSHRTIADAVYRQVPDPRAKVLHARCASVLAERPNVSVSQLSRLAHHHERAGSFEAAYHTSARAADLAFSLADYDAAGGHLRSAVKLYENPEARSRLQLQSWDLVKLETLRYHVESRRGNPAISILHARRALARADVDLPESASGWWWFILRNAFGELIHPLLDRKPVNAGTARIMRERIAPAGGLGQMYYNQDDLVASIGLHLLIVRTARKVGEPDMALASFYTVAALWDLLGLRRLARRYEQYGEAALRAPVGDLGARVNALVIKSSYWIHMGNVADADAAAVEACGYRSTFPDPYWIETAWIARSNSQFYQAQYADSLASADEILLSAETRDSAPYICWGHMLRARVFEVLGEPEQAAEALAAGRRHFDQQTEQIHRLAYSGLQALAALEIDGLDTAQVIVEETLDELNGIQTGHVNLLEAYRGALEVQMRQIEFNEDRPATRHIRLTLKSLARFCRITRIGVPLLLIYQGRLHKVLANEKESLRYYQKAANLAERWSLPREGELAHSACAGFESLGETARREHQTAAARWRGDVA